MSESAQDASPEEAPAPAGPPVVTVYSRPGCHLCEEAWQQLIELHPQTTPFELREINIESDDRLHAEMLELIPVIELDGERISELGLDEDTLRARLAMLDR